MELNVLAVRLLGYPVGAIAVIAFCCKQTPKLLGTEFAFELVSRNSS